MQTGIEISSERLRVTLLPREVQYTSINNSSDVMFSLVDKVTGEGRVLEFALKAYQSCTKGRC